MCRGFLVCQHLDVDELHVLRAVHAAPLTKVMYAIRTRNGQVYLNIKRNYGDMTAMEVRCSDE